TLKDLLAESHSFSFFQAIRVLERLGGARIGREGPADDEVLRLRPSRSLGFAPADIDVIEKIPGHTANGETTRYQITARFLGLYGTTSPLPVHYSVPIAQAEQGYHRVRAFLDVFHHRLLSLFYRAWARHHYIAEFQSDGNDDISRRLLAWLGIDEALAQE